jgi:hypothetical protein
VVEFGEWLCMEVLKKVPHRHFILSIPKILRRYFLYDRKLLSSLSRCAWEALKEFYQVLVDKNESVPGAAVAIQTFGDFLGFNPHTHVLISDGCFYKEGTFKVAPKLQMKVLEALFQHKVLKMLLNKGKINKELISLLLSWRHSGFNVFCGKRIYPGDERAMENLARYIIRASFSQERMTYLRDESKVVYQGKDAKKAKTFEALEWLAAMCSHVPNRGEQMVRYYGYYSNVKRGKRKKAEQDAIIPCIIEEVGVSPEQRKSWARLIQKIYEVDPLTCPHCQGSMKIIAFIEQEEVIKKILKHLGLWFTRVQPGEVKGRPPPRIHSPPAECFTDYPDSQITPWDDDYSDPDYPFEAYL